MDGHYGSLALELKMRYTHGTPNSAVEFLVKELGANWGRLFLDLFLVIATNQ